MKTQNASPKERFPFPLLCLTLGAFAIGMTEFIIMGLLPNVAHDLNVSIPRAGFLITGYALGVAVGAPVLTILTLRVPQKKLLVLLMLIFIAGNALSVIAPSFALLLAARVLTAFAHGTFLGVGSLIASRLVRPEKQAGAVSLVLAGLSIANIVGVPFGTMIGQQLGWRASFAVIVGLGIVALLGIIRFIPQIRQDEAPRLDRELKSLLKPRVLLMLGIGMFGCACLFSLFTYITPMLENISGFAEHEVTYILILFGFGITIGNLLGGRLADWKLMPSVTAGYIVLALLLAALAAAFHHPVAAVVTVFLWGVAAFGVMPGVNFRIMDLAKEAPLLAATSTHSVLNIGNAGGSYVGGLAITYLGLSHLPWVAASLAVVGLLGCFISFAADRRAKAGRTASAASLEA